MLTLPRRSRVRAVAQAPILLALALACLFVGGRPWPKDAEPERLQVHEVVPGEVEAGDRIAILGAGFAPGKPARVTFRGTLHRSGERPLRGAEIVASARVVGPERLELAFDEATQALFCGAGLRARHTTFEGDVEVAFAAATPGEAPAAGRLEHVTLDVRPSASGSRADLEQQGERMLAWIGVKAAARGSGLVIEAVKAGSRADAAGIAGGDVVTRFDGVRVASAADVVPPPGERAATIAVRSGTAATESVHVVPLDGFRRVVPAERIGATLLALIGLCSVLLFGAPARPTVAAALQRVISRMRERARAASSPQATGKSGLRTDRGGAGRWALLRAMAAVGRSALPPHGPQAAADLVVCAVLAAMPFGQYVIAARLDVGLLFVAAATSLAAAGFMTNGTAWRGTQAALGVAWRHAPSAAAVASVVMMTGSLRIQEIERAQGGWPWDWLAFRSPAALVALGLLLTATRIEPDIAPARSLASLLEGAGGARQPRGPWLEAACRAHHVAVAGLASALFLGGWHLPGLLTAEQDAGPAIELAGAAWLLAKTWTVVVIMAWIGWALPRWGTTASTLSAWLWLTPVAVGMLAATAAWTWWSPSPPAQLLMSLSLVAAVGLGGIALVHRVCHGLASAAGDGRVSGFI